MKKYFFPCRTEKIRVIILSGLCKFTMIYTVGMLWAMYIVVVFAVFVVMYLVGKEIEKRYPGCGCGCYMFVAALFGAVSVYYGSTQIVAAGGIATAEDQSYLNYLYIVAYALPILAVLYMVSKKEDPFRTDNTLLESYGM